MVVSHMQLASENSCIAYILKLVIGEFKYFADIPQYNFLLEKYIFGFNQYNSRNIVAVLLAQCCGIGTTISKMLPVRCQ